MLEIELDFSDLRALAEHDPAAELAIARATQRAAEYVQNTWQLVAEGYCVPGMHRAIHDPLYSHSIGLQTSTYHATVFTTYPGALSIQMGTPPRDLKPGLLSGPHAKVSQTGHRYNIVPLRHATPGNSGQNMLPALPNDVYIAALRGQRISPASEMGLRHRQPGWSVGSYAGLRREVRPGGQRGQYRTYRAVSDRSEPSKWVLPSVPPMDVRRLVWEHCQPKVEQIIAEELRR